MATEYGVHYPGGTDRWIGTRDQSERIARDLGLLLIAREVSEPRIVSIRA